MARPYGATESLFAFAYLRAHMKELLAAKDAQLIKVAKAPYRFELERMKCATSYEARLISDLVERVDDELILPNVRGSPQPNRYLPAEPLRRVIKLHADVKQLLAEAEDN